MLSENRVQLHPNGDDVLKADLLSFGGGVLSSVSSAVGSTGRASLDISLPSNIYTLIVYVVRADAVTATGTIKGRDPALRSDGSDEYVAH